MNVGYGDMERYRILFLIVGVVFERQNGFHRVKFLKLGCEMFGATPKSKNMILGSKPHF